MNNDTNKTQGEIQFEEYCVLTQIEYTKIPTRSDKAERTPDYIIKIGEQEIIAEIKDFDLTDEDKINIENFESKGFFISETHKPGNKIRAKINDAKGQLKKDKANIIVLYDNRHDLVASIYDYEIKVAMYGLETCLLNTPEKNSAPQMVGKKFGKEGSTLRTNQNTRISAIGVLKNRLLHIFHNSFAVNPLNIDSLAEIKAIIQYKIDIDKNKTFGDWIKINN